MFLITGLGNPGPAYQNTRHNMGFMLVDRMADQAGKRFQKVGRYSLTCQIEQAEQQVILAKPQTYMNLSGMALCELLETYPVELEKALVAFDDLALPLGTIRIRRTGGSSGQKGMDSIIAALGTQQIPRLRFGILSGTSPSDYSDFVLAPFTRAEGQILEETLDRAAQAVETIVSDGLDRAMSRYN